MGQICTVCAHELSFEINEALIVSKQSNRSIAKQFGVDHNAVQRHRQHIPELLLEASQSLQVFDADRLLEQIEELRLKAMAVLEAAEAAHDHRTMLAAIDRASKQLELLAEMTGKLQRYRQVNYVFISPAVQDVIAAALERYPEAGLAVSDALSELEPATNE